MSEKLIDSPFRPTDTEILASAPSIAMDSSDYAEELEAFNLPKDLERELLETLWSIMCSFVELGFDVDILQLFVPGKDSDGVKSEETSIIKAAFNANGKERAT